MDQEKIGKFIKEIRLKEKLSQKEFASKYGVTYQAVSKWENGKNIPDISILKQMCEEYHTNLDDFLETKIARKKWDNSKVIMFVFLLVLCIGIVLFFVFHRDDFEFKTLSSNCDNFNLFGSIAYNANKSSIYISNITYCGKEDFTRYQTIHCALYELVDKTTTQISRCDYQKNNLVTLNEFLNSVSIQVDNYDKNCKTYQENSLYLEIEAIYKENQIRIYKIPLQLEGMCEK